jgi:predicted TIM-barrel fold metal-dependent hydrolase
MIVDAHAYCFPPLGQANGFPTAEDHLRYLQRMIASHRQAPWRLKDHAMGDNAALANLNDLTIQGVRDVNFRAGGYGRFVWTVNGDDYAKQYLPPTLTDLSCPPEMLIAQMDYVGIDYALLHANPIMGLLNDFVADCVVRYPDRLRALAAVPEWKIDSEPDQWIAEVARAYDRGLNGLQFISDSRFRHGVHQSWDQGGCRTFWDGVVALGKPIFFTLHTWPTLPEYFDQLRIWSGWLSRYPDVPVVHTHGFPWGLLRDGATIRLPDALFEPFRASKAKLELLFPITIGHIWDYPYREVQPAIVELVRRLGADRLMWGTDMPNVERHCNYRQTVDMFRVHCRDLIGPGEMRDILGGTCARLLRLPSRSSVAA